MKKAFAWAALIFGLLYFILPFAIALGLMAAREIWANIVMPWVRRRRTLPPGTPGGTARVPVCANDSEPPAR